MGHAAAYSFRLFSFWFFYFGSARGREVRAST